MKSEEKRQTNRTKATQKKCTEKIKKKERKRSMIKDELCLTASSKKMY